MKKLVLSTAVLFSTLLFAQTKTGPVKGSEPNGEKRITTMTMGITNACKLTAAQQIKVKPIVSEFVKTNMANKEKFANNPEGMKNASKTNRENFETGMKGVLAPAQLPQFQTWEKEEMAKMKEKEAK